MDPIISNEEVPIYDLAIGNNKRSILILKVAKSENHRKWQGRILAKVLKHRGNIYGDVCTGSLSTYGELRKSYGISMTSPSPPSGDKNPVVDVFFKL